MPFVEKILSSGTLSIVGLEKNTGKTECLNYILRRLSGYALKVGVTSIGVDGEKVDQVTQSSKPEIFLGEGILFSTSEKHYRERQIYSELLSIDETQTSLGRICTARALGYGKVLLSGPSQTASLITWIKKLKEDYSTDLCIIDGALSRLSLASPAVSESMILATGAALSSSIPELVNKTHFITELINIPETGIALKFDDKSPEKGIWQIGKGGNFEAPLFESAFIHGESQSGQINDKNDISALFVAGALTDRFLKMISTEKKYVQAEIIVKDFTRIFVTPATYRNFIKKGGIIRVLRRSNLIAVCVNPTAPNGVVINSDKLCGALGEKLNLPVYDIIKNGYEV
jgi:hypothetical protein